MILMWICVGVYLFQTSSGPERVFEQWSVYGPSVAQGEWWRLVTGAFVHANLLHLGTNMMSLFVLGKLIEADLDLGGRWRFLLLCAVSLLGGSAGVLALSYETVTVGISGLVFGLLGAAVSVPRRVGLSWNHYKALPWVGLNLVLTFAIPGISVGGHLGGLIAGFVAAWFLVPDELVELART